jgi:hypothetical protein
MPFDKFIYIDNINEARRKAVAKSIRTISTEELKKLGDQIFDSPDHPWREKFFQLIAENPAAGFYHADAGEGSFFSTTGTRTKDCGVCPKAAWDHCR